MDDASVLLELVRFRDGELSQGLELFERERTRPLEESGLVLASQIFALRHQECPATPLGEGCVVSVQSLASDAEPRPWTVPPEAELLGSTLYRPIEAFGEREAPDEAEHASLMMVLAHPTDLAYDAEFNA